MLFTAQKYAEVREEKRKLTKLINFTVKEYFRYRLCSTYRETNGHWKLNAFM